MQQDFKRKRGDDSSAKHESRRLKKRKRKRKSLRDVSQPHVHCIDPNDRIFNGRCFAVSLNQRADVEDASASRQTVEALVSKHGGKVVNTVNKRVFCLLASDLAVESCTQRVRKAVKRGVAVVRPAFVHACIKKARLLPLSAFSVAQEEIEESLRKLELMKSRKTDKVHEREDAQRESSYIRKIHIQCACSCHDDELDSCSFCVAHHQEDV